MVFRSTHSQVDAIMRKQTTFQLLVVASIALLVAGCSLAPGGDIDYEAPESGSPDLMQVVDIKPITPELIRSLASQQDQTRGVLERRHRVSI